MGFDFDARNQIVGDAGNISRKKADLGGSQSNLLHDAIVVLNDDPLPHSKRFVEQDHDRT